VEKVTGDGRAHRGAVTGARNVFKENHLDVRDAVDNVEGRIPRHGAHQVPCGLDRFGNDRRV
jgi:hypothetical protein